MDKKNKHVARSHFTSEKPSPAPLQRAIRTLFLTGGQFSFRRLQCWTHFKNPRVTAGVKFLHFKDLHHMLEHTAGDQYRLCLRPCGCCVTPNICQLTHTHTHTIDSFCITPIDMHCCAHTQRNAATINLTLPSHSFQLLKRRKRGGRVSSVSPN